MLGGTVASAVIDIQISALIFTMPVCFRDFLSSLQDDFMDQPYGKQT